MECPNKSYAYLLFISDTPGRSGYHDKCSACLPRKVSQFAQAKQTRMENPTARVMVTTCASSLEAYCVDCMPGQFPSELQLELLRKPTKRITSWSSMWWGLAEWTGVNLFENESLCLICVLWSFVRGCIVCTLESIFVTILFMIYGSRTLFFPFNYLFIISLIHVSTPLHYTTRRKIH